MHPRFSSLMASLLGLGIMPSLAVPPTLSNQPTGQSFWTGQHHAEPARKAKRALNKRIGHRQARRQTCNSYALKASRACPAATLLDPTIVA